MPRRALPTDVVRGARVLITGAARGMGAMYARRAAREGAATIALWDVDSSAAEQLAAELTAGSVQARAFTVDVSQQDQVAAAASATREALGAPTILINNAGIVRGARFWEHDPSRDIERTMRINSLAPMWLTREFLPGMMADVGRPQRILTISSAAGVMANPQMSVYASSKWALIGWSESLRLELERDGYRHVGVTAFCPSFVATGMFAGARGPLMTPIMTPEQAVDIAWNGMLAATPLILRPRTVRFAMAARGLLPTRAWDVVADRIFHVYSSMDAFTGRADDDRAAESPGPVS